MHTYNTLPPKNKNLNWFKTFVGNQDHCEECYHMWNIRLFSQLYRVQTHVCIYFLIFEFSLFIHYLKKSLIGSTVSYLQSLLLGLEVAFAAAVQTGMFFVLSYHTESAQIPSLWFLSTVLPCWLHMRSTARLSQPSINIRKRVPV